MTRVSRAVSALLTVSALIFASAALAEEEIFDPVSVLGPAPWAPTVGGHGGKTCDLTEVAYNTRCQRWQKEYDAWQEKARALMKEHAENTAK